MKHYLDKKGWNWQSATDTYFHKIPDTLTMIDRFSLLSYKMVDIGSFLNALKEPISMFQANIYLDLNSDIVRQ